MTIKDFKPGQDVFVLEKVKGGIMEFRTHKRTVQEVGCNCVKIVSPSGEAADIFYQLNEKNNYLVGHKDWVSPPLLFVTEEAVTDYIEQLILMKWVMENLNWYKIKKYSLKQLREVKKILEAEG